MQLKNVNIFHLVKPKRLLYISTYTHLNKILIYIFLNFIILSHGQFEITLIMQGNGNQAFINEAFYSIPSEVKVNGVDKPLCQKNCNFEEDLSNVTIKFDSYIISCENMFNSVKGVLEIDLSNLDFSYVTNMSSMFNQCINLKKITFGNINTSKVESMSQLFHNCSKLTSIDLSKFDTSSVTKMERMFSHCKSLQSIDVSKFNTQNVENMCDLFAACFKFTSIDLTSFNTSKVKNMQGMFYCCYELKSVNLSHFDTSSVTCLQGMFDYDRSLIYINLYSFKIKNDANTINIFNHTSLNLKICISDLDTQNLLKPKNNDCNDRCFKNYIMMDLKNNRCVEYCNETEFRYEFQKNCYKECPDGSIPYNNSLKKEYYCKPICTTKKPYEIKSKQECVDKCSLNDIKENNCILNYKENKEEVGKFNDFILKNLENDFTSKDYNTSKLDNGENEIYEYEKMTITLTTTKNQRENRNINTTAIDLGECENLLKDKYNISRNEKLYIKKIDVIQEGMKIPKIEFDVYYKLNGSNLEKLDISICENEKILLSIPVTITENLDVLNSSSGYYNDICYITTSDNGTDIPLKDRQKEYIEGNKTVCQDDCDFAEYDKINQKVLCSCKPKESSETFDLMNINKTKLYKNFIDIKNILNIKIMACYKVLLDKKGILKNIAFFLIIPFIIFHLIVIVIFYYKQKKLLYKKIKDISFCLINWKLIENVQKENTTKNSKKKENKKKKNKEKNEKNILNNKEEDKNKKEIKIMNSNDDNTIKNKNKKKKKKNNYNHNPVKKRNSTKKEKNINKNDFHFMNVILGNNINMSEQKIIKKSKEIMNYNDEELNNLPYQSALKFDKRTYCEYYISLLKTKHIIIFSFCNNKDYNSKIIKIDLFFISFILSYTVNALFFNDSTMHKIYEDQGSYNFIYQLPQIIYSSLISIILGLPLKLLALSEDNILELKKEKGKKNIDKKVKRLNKKLKIKFVLYFIIGIIFLLFFWYYLSMFCTIYRNTQYHLIKDTLLSFGSSLIEPFGLCLIPGFLRIPALSKPKNKRYYIYKLCLIFQIFL